MTAVVLDTDVASAILKGRLPEHLGQALRGRQLAITFVTVGELAQWTHLHRWGSARRAGLQAFLHSVVILNSTVDAATVWGDIQAAARAPRQATTGQRQLGGRLLHRPRAAVGHVECEGLPRLRRPRGSGARRLTHLWFTPER